MNRLLTAHFSGGADELKAVSVQGKESLSTLYRFAVQLASASSDIDCQRLIGQSCAIELEAQDGHRRYFSGQIVRMGALGKRGRYWRYEAHLSPKLWHAGRASDFKIWQSLTVKDIAEEILGKHAIRHDWRTKSPLKTWEYKVQYGETDLAFLTRLLEHEGIYYWFEHSLSGETLILADHFTTPGSIAGYETISYYPPDEAREDEDHYWDWHAEREPEPGQYSHSDYDFKKPAKDLSAQHADPRGHLFDQYEIYAYPGNYIEPGDGAQYANARLEALQVGQDVITLTGKVRGAIPGHRFTLKNHPRQEQNRELLIISAEYEASDNDYEALAGSQGTHYKVTITAQPANKGYRPHTAQAGPRARGPETAVVVGPAGEEIHTDEYGRVKVHFHWDRYGKKDGSDSCWIRVSSPWAGSNFGGIHIPRIGQEVIVDYEHGDPDRPIITGRVYNATQMPPWELPANKTQSGYLTRSSQGGAPGAGVKDGAGEANALRFEDRKGEEQLWLHAQKDQLTEVENDEDKWVGRDRRKTIERDETNTIHRDRTEVVDRNEKINIHGWRTEEVDLDETITIHQNRKERVDHNETISIGDDRKENVGKNEQVEIGIDQSLKVGKSRTKRVGKHEKDAIGRNWSIKVGRFKTETVGLAYMQNVGLGKMVNIGAAYNLNVGAMMFTNVLLNRSDTVGQDQTVKVGKHYKLTAGESLTLEVGKSVLVMKADGTVTVNGKEIDLVGDTHIGLESKRIDLN